MTVKKILFLLFSSSMILLSACTTSNVNDSMSYRAENIAPIIQEGYTTQQQVYEQLGPPDQATTTSEGDQVWAYHQHQDSQSYESNTNLLTIFIASRAQGSSISAQSSQTSTLVITFSGDVVDEISILNTDFSI